MIRGTCSMTSILLNFSSVPLGGYKNDSYYNARCTLCSDGIWSTRVSFRKRRTRNIIYFLLLVYWYLLRHYESHNSLCIQNQVCAYGTHTRNISSPCTSWKTPFWYFCAAVFDFRIHGCSNNIYERPTSKSFLTNTAFVTHNGKSLSRSITNHKSDRHVSARVNINWRSWRCKCCSGSSYLISFALNTGLMSLTCYYENRRYTCRQQ